MGEEIYGKPNVSVHVIRLLSGALNTKFVNQFTDVFSTVYRCSWPKFDGLRESARLYSRIPCALADGDKLENLAQAHEASGRENGLCHVTLHVENIRFS